MAAIGKEDDRDLRIEEAGAVGCVARPAANVGDEFATSGLLDAPGQAKLGTLSVCKRGRFPHLVEQRWGEEPTSGQSGIPSRQIKYTRHQTVWRVMPQGADKFGVLESSLFQTIACRTVGDDGSRIVESGGSHAERLEDALGQKLAVRLAADTLDDGTEQDIARAAIASLGPGREIEGQVKDGAKHLISWDIEPLQLLFRCSILPKLDDRGKASTMREQMTESHFAPACRG